MTRVVDPLRSPLPPPAQEVNPYRYGWRDVRRVGPDGREELDMVPLTLEDALHPQEGDHIAENTIQNKERRYLHDLLERRYAGDPTTLTLSDCLIDWGVPGLRAHSPDIAILTGVRTKHGSWGTFRLADEGGHPLLTLEIVSPSTREYDVFKKVDHYHRVGIPYYVIVDREREDDPARIVGYRDTPDGYVEMPLDEHGRLWLEVVGIWIGPKAGSIVCYDGATGEEIGDYMQICQALEAAEQRAAEEQARAQAAEARLRELEEELRRLRGQA